MRARLEQWFQLRETVSFDAQYGCAAGVFRLADADIGAAMPVAGSVREMLIALPRRGVAALNDPRQAPDRAMTEAANAERATGMAMRRIGLEARDCLRGPAEGAFRQALISPGAVLAYDRTSATLMLLDPGQGVLIAAMGAG